MIMLHLARRSFLQSAAGLVVAFTLPRAANASPATLDTDSVDAYLVIAPDGTATVYAGKVDIGTGARAAIRQIVAEEIGMRPERIDMVEGDTLLTPNQGGTGGSTGIMVGGMQIRQAAATARQGLIALAAKQMNRPASELDTANGAVVPKAGGAGIGFSELVGGRRFDLAVDKSVKSKNPDDYTVVGKSFPRPDLPAKFTGTHEFVQDVRVDGMLHARVIRPPRIGAGLQSVDNASIAKIPGAQIVRVKDFLAVVAPREWDAVRAMRALRASWGEAPALPNSGSLYDTVRQIPVSKTETVRSTGDTGAVFANAARVMSATYRWPIQSHASMGPSCAVADIKDGGGTVWTASQGTHGLRQTIAQLLGLDAARLRLIYRDGSGSYGTNGNNDAAFEAALISRELKMPVRVQWMREDELGWDPKGPPQILDVRAALDASGEVLAWETVALAPENTPGGIPLLAAIAAGLANNNGMSSGQLQSNVDPPYLFPAVRADMKWLAATPLRPSNLRAPGKIGNVMAVECFADEIAAAARIDPLEFRLKRLNDPRAIEVLTRVGRMMAWSPRTAAPDRAGAVLSGKGISYMHYKQAENYVAMGMEIEVDRASGRVRVTRVACAHDCGQMINPDAVRSQVEGSILQTISRTLFEEVKFESARVTTIDWAGYPILTFPDVPRLEIELIDRPHERPVGAGEASTAPVAATLGNAIFDATGLRLREVPFTPERIKAAFAASA
jgi:CO/xanthine dehydrogenase Mo-binding subunit